MNILCKIASIGLLIAVSGMAWSSGDLRTSIVNLWDGEQPVRLTDMKKLINHVLNPLPGDAVGRLLNQSSMQMSSEIMEELRTVRQCDENGVTWDVRLADVKYLFRKLDAMPHQAAQSGILENFTTTWSGWSEQEPALLLVYEQQSAAGAPSTYFYSGIGIKNSNALFVGPDQCGAQASAQVEETEPSLDSIACLHETQHLCDTDANRIRELQQRELRVLILTSLAVNLAAATQGVPDPKQDNEMETQKGQELLVKFILQNDLRSLPDRPKSLCAEIQQYVNNVFCK